ncbi:gamma-glutamyltranspeptidase 1 [Tanacetum coccineum]
MAGDTPTPPKPPIDKAYSIASIKACIPTPLDLDKLNYNSWSSLFQRFCKTYEVHHHLAAPSTTATSTVDPLHDTNDSLVVMWIYATISPKLVEMIVDVDSTAHGVWNRLKDLFHDNKDARITQLDNEIRNMAIGNLSITDFFQQLKSKADRLANLESPVKRHITRPVGFSRSFDKYQQAISTLSLQQPSTKTPSTFAFDYYESYYVASDDLDTQVDDVLQSLNPHHLFPENTSNIITTYHNMLHGDLAMTDLGSLNYSCILHNGLSSVYYVSQSNLQRNSERCTHAHIATPSLQYLLSTPLTSSNAVQNRCVFICMTHVLPHLLALKRILRYVRGTLTFGLQIHASTTAQLTAYTDADWAGCPVTRRSTSGYCVFLGNNLLSWSAKRQILNIIALYGAQNNISGPLFVHRHIESIKHAFAKRMNLGDPDFVNIEKDLADMISPKFAQQLKKTIYDNKTFSSTHYGGRSKIMINSYFGAKILSPNTGIVLNNHMDDFSIPTNPSSKIHPPAPSNFISPGKRPLSSATPTIVLKDGNVKAVLGASGGVKIIPATTEVFVNYFAKGMDPLSAILAPRFYHQLIPNVVWHEKWTAATHDHFEIDVRTKMALRRKGHVLRSYHESGSVCQLVVQEERRGGEMARLVAVSDPRKGGFPAGY